MDLPVSILPDPERPFGPCEARVTTAAWRRDRRQHTAGFRIDLLDAIFGDLKQVRAIERRSCMCGNVDRAQGFPALGIEVDQLVPGSQPDALAVIRDAMHMLDARKGTILPHDFGCCFTHDSILVTWQRSRE
jgi:hypothetical protein